MRPVLALLVAGGLVTACRPAFADPAATAEVIRAEATRPNQGPDGRPLPLAAHWNRGQYPTNQGWSPAQQMKMIEQGHFILPWFKHPPLGAELPEKAAENFKAYYEGPIHQAARWHLPLTLIDTQWERGLSDEPYRSLPPEKNPNVVSTSGKILKRVSPFGPVEPWREIGRTWTANGQMQTLQKWYPDPPLVIFLSNNEHSKQKWATVEESQRYLDKYGPGRDDDFKRRVVAEGWIERYRALQDGMRSGLGPAWRGAAAFVGYGAFGPPHLGRWPEWPVYSLYTPGRISPYPLMWDGGSPSYYTHDWDPGTDYTVWSPQVEFMNLVFMREEALRLNPKFWLEISIWDGNHGPGGTPKNPSKSEVYQKKGQTWGPERYEGYVQFGLWLLRPRAVREFRGSTHPSDLGMPYFMAIVAAVDRVHNQPTLREFWRKGELVANRAHPHPYQTGIPEEYRGADRWFLLDADCNPREYPWKLDTEIGVFSLALVQGDAPRRRWLVYAHAPLGRREGVRVTIPDYRPVAIDVGVGGSFYRVEEESGRAAAVK